MRSFEGSQTILVWRAQDSVDGRSSARSFEGSQAILVWRAEIRDDVQPVGVGPELEALVTFEVFGAREIFAIEKTRFAALQSIKPKKCLNMKSNQTQPVVSFRNAAFRIRDRVILPETSWEIFPNQNWAVLGPNGAGKSTLVRALAGDVPAVRGSVERNLPPGRIGFVSFEFHRDLAAAEENLQFARHFSGRPDETSSARRVLFSKNPELDRGRQSENENLEIPEEFREVVSRLRLCEFLDRGIDTLSTGQMRKLLIARALVKRPKLLILDEPFDGLDIESRRVLLNALEDHPFNHLSHGEQRMVLLARSMVKSPEILILYEPCQGLDTRNRRAVLELIDRIGSQTDTQLLYVTHHPEEIPACTTHVLSFERLDSGAFTARSLER